MDSEDKGIIAIIAVWVFLLLLNIVFWGAIIALGFYAVNQFSD